MPWWWGIVTFAFGSGGAFTIIWFVFTRRINKADQKKASEKAHEAEEQKKRAEANQREWLLVKAYRQKLGSVLFWMTTEMEGLMEKTGHKPVNGHLKAAWASFDEAEAELKQFENEQASSLHKD